MGFDRINSFLVALCLFCNFQSRYSELICTFINITGQIASSHIEHFKCLSF